MYSEKLIKHFQDPHNVGVMEDADIIGEAGSPTCGDTTTVYLKMDGNIIKDISFQTYGCAAAIASSSVLTDMVKGMTVEEAMKVSKNDIVEELGGMPAEKVHCSLLAEDALKIALKKALDQVR
ncbi:MAG: iron-sulfur cluster assembly scaffold protein [Christensenellaceae bacterium]